MARVAPIRLALNPRTLWFDPCDLELSATDAVVVETARGNEFGHMAGEIFDADEAAMEKLKSPLKPVVRKATEEDAQRAKEMEQLGLDAMPAFREMAAEMNPDMRPVSVEYLLDGDKAVFYFESEERVDFRDLVRKLAAYFHVRIDMRQIGVRDEARMVGGLGHCGQELCCCRMGGEFCPVSIRMAKDQDLSLNPQKISGVCGRLMCCLRYESDTYREYKSMAPKANATVQTPDGPGKVVDIDVPRELISIRVGDEKPLRVSLDEFEPAEEGKRPSVVSEQGWADAKERAENELNKDAAFFLTSQFTGDDRVGEAGAISRGSSGRNARGKSNSMAEPVVEEETEPVSRRRRRRRSKSEQAEAVKVEPRRQEPGRGDRAGKKAEKAQSASRGAQQKQRGRAKDAEEVQVEKTENQRSSRRRRNRGSRGGQQGEKAQQPQQAQQQSRAQTVDKGQAQSKPRPGQKSSRLRERNAQGGEAAPSEGATTHRRSRRRSHTAGGASSEGKSE